MSKRFLQRVGSSKREVRRHYFELRTSNFELIALLLGSLLGLCGGRGLAVADQQDQPWSYDPKGKRDPFIPLVRDGRIVSVTGDPTSPDVSTPLLAGILWDPGGESIALINDTEVRIGERIGGYQVAEIRPDAVVLVREGESLVLQITFEEPANPNKGTKSHEAPTYGTK